MKTKLTHRFLALAIIAAALIATGPANAATVFAANFDGTTIADLGGTIGFGAQLTETNLNAGTATGTWTVNQAQGAPTNRNSKMIQGNGGANVTNKALRTGNLADGTMGVNTPYLTANLTSTLNLTNTITVSFDQGYVDVQGTSQRYTYLTGRDSSNNRLFQIGFLNEDGGLSRLGYMVGAGNGTFTAIGANGDLLGNSNTYWNASLMKTVTVDVGASTYDIKLAGTTLASGIAFRDVAATGLSKLEFSQNSNFTGSAFDNITVSQIPEPAAALLGGLGFLVLLRRRR